MPTRIAKRHLAEVNLELAQPKVVELATRSRLVDLLEVQIREKADEWYALVAAYARALDAIPGEDILRFVTKHGFALGGYVEGKPVAVLGAPPPSAPPGRPRMHDTRWGPCYA